MVANYEQVKELFAQAKKAGCFLMEAEKTMFTPLNVKLKEMIESGVIGKLRAIRAEYSYQVLEEVDGGHWVLDKNMGGSAYDIGVYPISFSHYFANSKIENLIVKRVDHPKYECDFGMQADICYENGVYGFLQSNWFYTPEHKGSAILAGEDGYIEVPAFWKGTKAYLYKNGIVEEIETEMESDFEGEVTHAAECIENNMLESPVLGEYMSLEIIKVVEGIL
jgi:predicted dehydrogenase